MQSSDVALLIKTQSDQFFKELVVPVDSPALNSYIAFCEAAANRLQFPAQNVCVSLQFIFYLFKDFSRIEKWRYSCI